MKNGSSFVGAVALLVVFLAVGAGVINLVLLLPNPALVWSIVFGLVWIPLSVRLAWIIGKDDDF